MKKHLKQKNILHLLGQRTKKQNVNNNSNNNNNITAYMA